ncbi:hypothetical protein Q8A67_023797 [Cirrhinus molitorella]|uniref:Uncharacterized protein n=1 Tax=Cirrhinus molitorella TaxID=172907 RepID=A0AA88P0J2_9TELE|nr:hypothetical protein Q8A67_023797 [Cirrhinus molitorella]
MTGYSRLLRGLGTATHYYEFGSAGVCIDAIICLAPPLSNILASHCDSESNMTLTESLTDLLLLCAQNAD